jgi:hypothetical protein
VNIVAQTNVSGTGNVKFEGNGFFVTSKHFIVCPAHLVIMDPALTRVPAGPSGEPTPFNQIFVDVFNVNGSGASWTYQARLVGVDGAADIAVLRISHSDNPNPPKLRKCHPYLKFGSSLKYSPGNQVFSIGTLFRQDFQSIAEGIVRNNKALDQSGSVVYEMMSTTLPYNAFSTVSSGVITKLEAPDGAPILDVTGRVVGMIATAANTSGSSSWTPLNPAPTGAEYFSSDNYAVGPSQRFMRCVLRAIIKSYCKGAANSHTTAVVDPGNGQTFYKYTKGFLGLNFTVVDADFYTTNTGANCRQIIGLGITGTSAISFAGYTGGILSHINCVELGNLSYQLAPTLLTWRKSAGDKVKVTLRPAQDTYNDIYETSATLLTFPNVRDYSPLSLKPVPDDAAYF